MLSMKFLYSYNPCHFPFPIFHIILVIFHFIVLTKTRIDSACEARNKAFILADLIHNCFVIVENTC